MFSGIKRLLGKRPQGVADPRLVHPAQSDYSQIFQNFGRNYHIDELYDAARTEPTAHMCVQMPATDVAQTTMRVYRRRKGAVSTIAEHIDGRQMKSLHRRWERDGARTVKAMVAQMGDDIEEVTDPTDPVVRLIRKPNSRESAFSYTRGLVTHRRTAGRVFEIPVVRDGIPVQLEYLSEAYVRCEIDRTFESLISGYVAHRNGVDIARYRPDQLVVYGAADPVDPTRSVSALASCLDEVRMLWAMTQSQTAMLANGGRPGGVLQATSGAADQQDQRDLLQASLDAKYSGPENAGSPLVIPNGFAWTDPATGKELDFVASIQAVRKIIMEAMGIPSEIMDTQTANLAGSIEAEPKYVRRTLLPIAREIVDGRNEILIPMFGPEFSDYFVDFDDMVGQDLEAETRVRVSKVQSYLTVNEARADDGYEEVEGGDVVASLQAPAFDPLAGLFGGAKSLDESPPAPPAVVEDIEFTIKTADEPKVITDIDVKFYGEKLPGCGCEACADKNIDKERAFRENVAKLAKETDSWSKAQYEKMVRLLGLGSVGKEAARAMLEQAAEDFLDKTAESMEQVFLAGFETAGLEDDEIGVAVPQDEARERYQRYRIGLSKQIAETTLEQSQRMVDAVINPAMDRGMRQDEISKLLEERVPGLSRSRAETIARTEVSETLQKGRMEAWKASPRTQGKRYLLSSDPCEICTYVDRKWKGQAVPIDTPFLTAGEAVPLKDGSSYVVTRDIQTANSHPRCRCGVGRVTETSPVEGDE